jgi:hypothetical protein
MPRAILYALSCSKPAATSYSLDVGSQILATVFVNRIQNDTCFVDIPFACTWPALHARLTAPFPPWYQQNARELFCAVVVTSNDPSQFFTRVRTALFGYLDSVKGQRQPVGVPRNWLAALVDTVCDVGITPHLPKLLSWAGGIDACMSISLGRQLEMYEHGNTAVVKVFLQSPLFQYEMRQGAYSPPYAQRAGHASHGCREAWHMMMMDAARPEQMDIL